MKRMKRLANPEGGYGSYNGAPSKAMSKVPSRRHLPAPAVAAPSDATWRAGSGAAKQPLEHVALVGTRGDAVVQREAGGLG
ncbi:MAG: hypothetical protein OEM98_12780 [Gammaproteobacteria bacterium]|nr:hypothetical protein [Gammaproteobacteria bacterium]